MANLSEEERRILEQARQIQDRLEAERLEAGEIELESEKRRRKREEQRRQQQRYQSEAEKERRRQQEIIRRRRQMEMNQRIQSTGQVTSGNRDTQNQPQYGGYRVNPVENSYCSPNTQRVGGMETSLKGNGSHQIPGQTLDLGKRDTIQDMEIKSNKNREYWDAAKKEVAAGEETTKRMARSTSSAGVRSIPQGKTDKKRVTHTEQQPKRRRPEEQTIQRKKKKKHKWMKKVIAVIAIVCMVLAIFFAGAYFIVRAIVSKTNYQPYETDYVRAADVMHDPDVMNILLIGSDERGSVDTARSDAMIVLSINQNTKKIVMTSILRDSYVEIPGYGKQRINHAYQMGGEALLIQTIEQNFKIGIDYYASVDFFSFMEIVDCVGGVEITVEAEEVQWVNAYVAELNNILGDPEGDQYIDGPGTRTLTGKQALAYSRIRYVGTDFARTERQRTVLNAVIEKSKNANPIQLFRIINIVLPDVSTNMDDHAMTMTLFRSLSYLNYEIVENRIPMDGTWWNEDAGGQEVLGMDFAANIAGLQNTIYGE